MKFKKLLAKKKLELLIITGRENLNFKNDWQKKTTRIEY
jgi:hypothetical protein